ncbi:hypothetical protein PNEG_01138 [Pneumocystis murina B123]|uniref:SURF4-domain-containing protein n=1 Tax=Pneumocystis murina (strain B123) TaxID=1069680 RepID=M7NT14_PNEMU|nr:hypothetical protein PNEG_01138 [Pneumocystis murina B123]EMR10422.1 hypothetical protein PNEG_01138 [Pneumocystis murina B123]
MSAERFPSIPISYNSPSSSTSGFQAFQTYVKYFEECVETFLGPVKHYVPALGRFLIIGTFMEDSVRILTQMRDQLYYLEVHRHFYRGLSHAFLIINVIAMLTASFMIVARKKSEIAVGILFGVVIAQAFGYGLIFDKTLFFRNISMTGGLLMVLSDSWSKKQHLFAGLPQLSETDRKKYFLAVGRVLLIFLFTEFIFKETWTTVHVFMLIFSLIACFMVIIGFKAKWSAFFLVCILNIFNILINNWWDTKITEMEKDLLKYDFFQMLSITGGLILLVNMGPGGFSVDEKKKIY